MYIADIKILAKNWKKKKKKTLHHGHNEKG